MSNNESTPCTASNCRIIAIVVTYNPKQDEIGRLLASVLPQVAALVIVDNGSEKVFIPENYGATIGKLHFLYLKQNYGVAYALNRGISKAHLLNATHVFLLDQDSEPAADCVAQLFSAYCKLENANERIAAVGPVFYDPTEKSSYPFLKLRGLSLTHYYCHDTTEIVPVDILITSGSLISLACLEDVGPMDEYLFIYYVDNEWCLRAKVKFYRSFGICSARMAHQHGEATIRLFRQHIPLRSPLMHYYIIRNAILLYRRSWVPWQWRLVDGYRVILKLVFYTLFIPSRTKRLRMIGLGIWHGIRGWGGRFDLAGK